MNDPPRISVWIDSPATSVGALGWPLAGRAFVDVTVTHAGRIWFESFLVDTGADLTMISAEGAAQLFGDAYYSIDFARDPNRVVIRGITENLRCATRELSLSFRTEAGIPLVLRAPVLIPEMRETPAGAPGRSPPSLLGRDLLGAGALTLAFRLPAELYFSNVPSGVQL